ncbi:hypothetical protein EIN_170990 [Entamoeba invadens IP1]|uniref:Nucleoplasmin-like domain-containing protein n=1 Tax=Entamoeba invadens IP1 TaxID=370355 RepID=A0A0A1TVP1_ENTIV|nr:hypothetical protein EIN_170990 [Entamoeba invadens IP1]ELP84554.1 hypothetical protein EIN_170990 [Entamoeba invadens IP1]|eukprot:XP_004183900.1 hypothetical protein EIN_170990 [Entamoeba invadens IP1]
MFSIYRIVSKDPVPINTEEVALSVRHIALSGDSTTSLFIKTVDSEGKEVRALVATLSQKQPQQTMDFMIAGKSVTFYVEGKSKIHMILVPADANMENFNEEDENTSDEDETLKENDKKPIKKPQEDKKPKKLTHKSKQD